MTVGAENLLWEGEKGNDSHPGGLSDVNEGSKTEKKARRYPSWNMRGK